ncbi:S24 family peptidase [Defluviimonas sp. WL0002]|uniref:S24 family peptidase n=1 Tax=Albidovulum marisflavi TaxID=2984159 RepID=A0ABT2ZHR1_9RHOB|nr:S24 family peptidase [Defluviimonas sp. WL0002]MCV2870657.1 S24 family peptidase [Defluviimonas sp. WL0002]
MEDTFKNALDRALEMTARSLRSVSIEAGVSYEKLKNLKQGKAQTTGVDDAMKVAAAFGVTLEDFYAGRLGDQASTIPVVGQVGAGAEVDLFDAYAKGDGHYRVQCPPQLKPSGTVAVEVVGDSMAPVYLPGSVLFYSRTTIGVPTEAIGRICVCEDDDGRAWVKQLRTGRDEGTFTLISMNPGHDHRHGVRLAWAAPVRFSLPPEFVRKID